MERGKKEINENTNSSLSNTKNTMGQDGFWRGYLKAIK